MRSQSQVSRTHEWRGCCPSSAWLHGRELLPLPSPSPPAHVNKALTHRSAMLRQATLAASLLKVIPTAIGLTPPSFLLKTKRLAPKNAGRAQSGVFPARTKLTKAVSEEQSVPHICLSIMSFKCWGRRPSGLLRIPEEMFGLQPTLDPLTRQAARLHKERADGGLPVPRDAWRAAACRSRVMASAVCLKRRAGGWPLVCRPRQVWILPFLPLHCQSRLALPSPYSWPGQHWPSEQGLDWRRRNNH